MREFTAEDVASYRELGFAVLRGVFTAAEVASMAEESTTLLGRQELLDRHNLRVRWTQHVETGAPLFELFDPVLDLAPICRRLMLDPRLTGVLAQLVGDEVCLFKDKLIYKPAGATGYPLHQDFIAWPEFPESFITAVVAIDAARPESGCIELFPRAQGRGYLSERDGNFHMLELDELPSREAVGLELDPGDVAIYGAFMPHRSEPNRSGSSRRHLLVSYNARREGGEQRAAHYQVRHAPAPGWALDAGSSPGGSRPVQS